MKRSRMRRPGYMQSASGSSPGPPSSSSMIGRPDCRAATAASVASGRTGRARPRRADEPCRRRPAPAAGEWVSEARENSTREFVCWLADQLAQAAGLAIELALVVYGAVSPECVQRSEIVADIRTELLEELGYASDALTRWGPLGLDAREAGREARIVLESVAHQLALAAYFWAEDTMPGEAGLQAVEIAAQLLAHAHRTATTADYDDWLE
jgi:hypothetical protein